MIPRTLRPLAVGLLALGLGACDLPTDLPSWDVTLRTPTITETINIVEEYLPGSARVDSGVFVFTPAITLGYRETLGSLVPSLVGLNDTEQVIPDFEVIHLAPVDVGTDFISTVLSEGDIEVTLKHTLPFSVLRGDNGGIGYVLIELRDKNNSVIRTDSVSGVQTDFAYPQGELVRTLDMSGVTLTDSMEVRVVLESPGSETPKRIDLSDGLSIDVRFRDLKTPTIFVAPDTVTVTDSIPMGFEIDGEMRAELLNPVRGASIRLDLEYPFALNGTMNLKFYSDSAGSNLVAYETFFLTDKSFRVSLAADQIRRFFADDADGIFVGYDVEVAGTGADGLAVHATDAITFTARFDMELRVNEEN